MSSRSTLVIVGMALLLPACDKAGATSLDPTSPLHCAAQFESYHILAKRMGDKDSAVHYGFRSQWYAERARSLPQEQRSDEALEELGDRIAAAADGGEALAAACQSRQDADPSFPRVKVTSR